MMFALATALHVLPLTLCAAHAMPVQSVSGASSTLTPVSGRCGKSRHRGYFDACRPGGGYNPHGPNRLRRGGPGRVAHPS